MCRVPRRIVRLALKVFTQVEGFPHYYYYGFISCPLLLLGLFNLIPDLKIPIWIVTCSFPIYLFHMFVLKAVRGAAVMMGISLNANVLMWAMSAVVIFGMTFGIVAAQRKLVPGLNRLLWGGR